MFRRLDNRGGHYLLLAAAAAVLFLPNLGAPSLWDIDEGNNATAAYEMYDTGDYVVPKFNGGLRVDKPALLYWLQVGAYRLFGVGEFAARLPSALAALAALLLTYELGRLLFRPSTGLLAGLILGSSALFCAAAHFANPDALLNAFTVLTFYLFCRGLLRGTGWMVPAGISSGLAVLAKGPVGLALPGAVACLYLLWTRRLRVLWTPRLLLGAVAFALVALPWYVWVGAETKTDFLQRFFFVHNVGRYLSPMENHGGPFYYYVPVFLLGFAPWSVFLGFVLRPSSRLLCRPNPDAVAPPDGGGLDREKFLGCWSAVYFLFFSFSGTKLPNYILPLYAPMALLTGHFLDRWRRGEVTVPTWAVRVSLACLALAGVGVCVGLLVAGGAVDLAALKGRRLAGVAPWAVVGVVPVIGAAVAWVCLARQRRTGVLAAVAVTAVAFLGTAAAGVTVAFDAHKAVRSLVQGMPTDHTCEEVRVGTYQWFQPSLVFYSRRQVIRLTEEREALEFFRYPVTVYVFMPARTWESLASRVAGPCRVLKRHFDLYRGCDVVLVTNHGEP